MVCDKLHIICGNCGQDLTEKDMATYEIDITDSNAIIGDPYNYNVFIHCKNCATVHSLEKYMKEEI